jgi:cob(I)alamin adenosyltransferase
MIHYYYGFGKGKTTASMGMVLRQLNIENRILIAQFLKDGCSGEICIFKQYPAVTIMVRPPVENYLQGITDEEKAAVKHDQYELFKAVISDAQAYDCIILDEIVDLIKLGVISNDELLLFLRENNSKEIVLTGHYLEEEIFKVADYVTEFSSKKHPFTKGVKARKGVEF